jgi:hypothetical protein
MFHDEIVMDVKLLRDYFERIQRAYKKIPKIIAKCQKSAKSVAEFNKTADSEMHAHPDFSPEKGKNAMLNNINIIRKIKSVSKFLILRDLI